MRAPAWLRGRLTSDATTADSTPWHTWVLWLSLLLLLSAGLLLLRSQLDKVHVALAYLIVVLGASSAGGRTLGLWVAALAFFLFDFLFLRPYYTLIIQNPFDWIILVAFLLTSIVAAQLLNAAQERAEAARRRAAEVERLATLGAETLNAGRAEEALAAVAEVIRDAIGAQCSEVLLRSDGSGASLPLTVAAKAGRCDGAAPRSGDIADWVAEHGVPAAERVDGTTWLATPGQVPPGELIRNAPEVRTLLLPLAVRDRIVGVLRLTSNAPLLLDAPRRQFLTALSYYAALGAERVRLIAEVERAEAFRQADALKSALVATVSHDLRTPLTTIGALAHRLARNGDPDATSITEEVDRLNRLIADVLDLSRLAAHAMPTATAVNSADELVGSALARVRGVTGSREVRVRRDPTGPVVCGRFDLVQSVRVLANLLENAIKYSPPDAAVELDVTRDAEWLRLVVSDRGPGVAAAESALIFEPFYRPPGVRPDVGGTGLGLAIARGLAEAQGGRVRYEPREGGGSRFVFELPVTDDAVAALSEPPSATTPPAAG